MPDCASYIGFSVQPNSPGDCTVRLKGGGRAQLLHGMLQSSGLAESVTPRTSSASGASRSYDDIEKVYADWAWVAYRLTGVRDEAALKECLALLQHRIVVGLSSVNGCYALGPYSRFDEEGESEKARFGRLVYGAKYESDGDARAMLIQETVQFVQRHPRLRSVEAVTAPPRSEPAARNLPWGMARALAETLGAHLVEVQKAVATDPQKSYDDADTEDTVGARVANAMRVDAPVSGTVLIVDDTLGSGGTVKEAARALRQAGARSVYGLCAAKNAKFRTGGLSLSKEHWQ